VFLASRPDLPIRLGFKRLSEDTFQDLILHEVPEIDHDIFLFLKHKLSKIQEDHSLPWDWPDNASIQKLAEMAVPLFIYAATLCRFIGDQSWDPEERIKKILEYKTDWQASKLYGTYLPILDQLVIDQDIDEKEIIIKEFRQIVGTIVNLASPLSISSLTRLLAVKEKIIECRLKTLHSVLNVPNNRHTPVRIFHLSFRDFLLDCGLRRKTPFWVDEKQSHRMIASKCIELMSGSAGLKEDICNIKSPGRLRSEINGDVIKRHLPSELRYACRYWVYHLKKSGEFLVNNDETHKFLQEHLLHWLEAMSLAGFMVETLNVVDTLASIAEVSSS